MILFNWLAALKMKVCQVLEFSTSTMNISCESQGIFHVYQYENMSYMYDTVGGKKKLQDNLVYMYIAYTFRQKYLHKKLFAMMK